MGELNKILHVEDEDDICEIAEMVLADIGGLEFMRAADGMKALEIVEAFKPDLILTDVQMPGMSGPETIGKIRTMPGFADIPAIYMTANVMGSEKSLLIDPSDIGLIPKPFDPGTLLDEIQALWLAHK